MNESRRTFVKIAALAAIGYPILTSPVRAYNAVVTEEPLKVHLFSKHLQFLDLKKAGQIAAELGFDGLDLTVRPKGHILPENVKSDLPKALQDIKDAGSSCEMITTAITSTSNPIDVDIIKTAAAEHIKYYRTDWFKYHKDMPMSESLNIYKRQINQLAELNKQENIVGCYQNHAGTSIGSSFWEVQQLLEQVDTSWFGTQYDIRHALVEGGFSWENGLRLLKDQIKVIVLKDFKWDRVGGKWQAVNVPIGEGMVDFTTYFKRLKSYGLNPPVSLHLEYDLGGAEKGNYEIKVDQKVVFDAMRRDLNATQKLWKEA